MFLMIKVVPKSARNEVLGWEEEVLKIKVKGVPENNEVNHNLIEFLSAFFDIPKTALSIASGHTSRNKRLFIEEAFADRVKQKMMLILPIEP